MKLTIGGRVEEKRYLLKPAILNYPNGENLLCRVLPYPKKALFILVDETLAYDENFKKKLISKVLPWLKPGRYIEIITFSSDTKGNYTDTVLKLIVDPEIPEFALISKYKKDYQKLHSRLLAVQKETVRTYLEESLNKGNPQIPKSDIIETLYRVSSHIKNFKSDDKIVLVVSDMLQNSDVTSFYYRGHIRSIDPKDEIEKVRKEGLFGDFGGAKIYVMGLGYFWTGERGKKEKYLGRKLLRLEKFWNDYFKNSNGRVVEIGVPMLLKDIH